MTNLKKTGLVFDIQSFSVHDGPGIRTLIFLKGCPLRCLWCANPEGQKLFPEVRYHVMKCVGCLACAEVCPHGAITLFSEACREGKKQPKICIDREKCAKCLGLECVAACPNGALQLTGKLMTVEEVVKAVKRDLPFYRGKGGVTLSGGDPVYQPEFAIELLQACKEEYVNTAIESAMFAKREKIEKFLPVTDLFLTDIKHMNSKKHKELTGVPNELILKNIALTARYKPVLVRVPIIPGSNDDDKNMAATAAFCLEYGITRINILPYHKLGVSKYEQLGMEYLQEEIETPDDDKMEHIKEIMEDMGVTCIIN